MSADECKPLRVVTGSQSVCLADNESLLMTDQIAMTAPLESGQAVT